MPVPRRMPDVVWRAGIDLNPLDVGVEEDVTWLEQLIWPEQTERLDRFLRAVAMARAEPPRLVRGDLLHDLPLLAREAPDGATLVVFHSAVLAYLGSAEQRAQFVHAVQGLDATWVSNEHPLVFPDIAHQLDSKPPDDRFLLAVDGHPVALTGPHGQSLDWL